MGQHTIFLLLQNRLNNVLGIHAIQHSLYKHQRQVRFVTYVTLYCDSKVWRTCVTWVNTLWEMLLHIQITMKSGPSLITIQSSRQALLICDPHWRCAWQCYAISESLSRGMHACSFVANKLFPTVHINPPRCRFILIFSMDNVQSSIVVLTMRWSWYASLLWPTELWELLPASKHYQCIMSNMHNNSAKWPASLLKAHILIPLKWF